ncbi:MAG TPA: sigma 54-interacting transcriptional regulator [Polyangiales bacterium]|nr:sigma 54-interacting transcriptional regulator [Polyangiales bacterium]
MVKALPETQITTLLGNPFRQRPAELDAAVSTLAAIAPNDLDRGAYKLPDALARKRAVLATLHARALGSLTTPGELTAKQQARSSALSPKLTAEYADELRIAQASARCVAQLRQLAGTSAALGRVRSEVWSACFGKTLVHAGELAQVIRGHDVLIIGETGVGKEELAHAIALGTVREHGDGAAPYAALNVAAVPETLVEAELFGHVKGAFTGAHSARVGLVRSADGGCLLLDEVGDLPLATQAKLLRVIETDRVQPLGTEQVHAVDVRFVSATHHDLSARIAQGTFRADLFQRLGALVIRVPPLRERPEDIAAIGMRFLRAATQRAPQLDTRSVERWLNGAEARGYHWPGNARELRNVVGNLLLGLPLGLARAGLTVEQDTQLPRAIAEASASWATVQDWYMKRVLSRAQGNVAEAARVLGLDRTTVIRKFARTRAGRET